VGGTIASKASSSLELRLLPRRICGVCAAGSIGLVCFGCLTIAGETRIIAPLVQSRFSLATHRRQRTLF
jgi:hypothetical protein